MNIATNVVTNHNTRGLRNSDTGTYIFYLNIYPNITLTNRGNGILFLGEANTNTFITNNGGTLETSNKAQVVIDFRGNSAIINRGIINGALSGGASIRFYNVVNPTLNGGIAIDNQAQGRINGRVWIDGNSNIQQIRNSGYIGGIDINNGSTLTTLNNNGRITSLDNSSGHINTFNHNANTTITLTSNGNSLISYLTNAGTINTNTSLVIAGVNNTNGSLANNGTINATNAQVSVYGNFNNTGTINTQMLTLGSSNPTPSATTTAHIGGTINNGAGGGTHLVLNDFAVELTQMANDYNALADLRNNTIGHIIIGNNANINVISAGNGANNRGIMIIADTNKWYQPYDYDALFVKNNNLASANNINIDTISAANLYTAQSTIQIYDVINPTNNKKAFQLNIQAKDSPAQTLSSTLLNGIISKNVLVGNLIDSMSRRTFHQSLSSQKGESLIIKSQSITRDGKKTKDNQDLYIPLAYDNIDILHETDMIFAPHTKEANKHTFFLPTSRYTRTSLSDGYTGTEYAGGFIGGRFFNLHHFGSLGVYGGYEYGQITLPRKQGAAYVKNHSLLFGAHYYKAFYAHKTSEYYMKLSLHSQIQIPHFELDLHMLNTKAKQNLFAFGTDMEYKLGINFYNIFNNSYISPEIGLGYGFLRLNAFGLDYGNSAAVNEYYPSHFFHLPSTSLQVKYLKALEQNMRLSFLLGTKYIIGNTQQTSLQIGQYKTSSLFHIPSIFGIGGVGFLYTLGNNQEISAQIDSSISKEQITASLSFRYSLWF